MKNNLRKIILGLSIGFALFISLFALDVIGQQGWIWQLIVHLVPTYVVIILTVISWKKEWLGGILWLVTGLFYLLMSWQAWVIYIPAIIIGGMNLFIDSALRGERKI